MKRFILVALVCVVLVGLSACSKDNAYQQSSNITQPQSSTTNTTATKPIEVGTSTSCEIAPKQLTLSGKTYYLSDNTNAEEGPIKLAYIKCEKGTFTIGESEDNFVIFSAGASNDIYLSGGRTGNVLHQFYTLEKATPSPSTATSSQPTSENDKIGQPIASFVSKSQDKQLSVYENANSASPLTAEITDKSGNAKNSSNIPIQKDWEKNVQKDGIFASIHSTSNINWILLSSDPAAGLMGKALYKTTDNGKSWSFVKDVSLIVGGYVTGVSFRDEKNGWISATYHGFANLPLYRTKDGGASWILQKIDIPKEYKYGNAYPPIFDENNAMHGTIKMEFVSDSDRKTVELRTTDGGETWSPQ